MTSPSSKKKPAKAGLRVFEASLPSNVRGPGNEDAAGASIFTQKRAGRQGMPFRCGFTVLAKFEPLETSQLIDQVMAPRMVGYCATGL